MNVNLTPALEKLVLGKVKTGRYNSASEVVREALRLMEQRDEDRKHHLADLRNKIDAGLHSLDQRKGIDGEKFMQELIKSTKIPTRRRQAS